MGMPGAPEESTHRISLVDNSHRPQSVTNMSANNEEKENVRPDSGEDTGNQKQGGSWVSKPEEMGNNIGGKIEDTLSPVGKYAGKGFEKAAQPIGGVVDPTVGGIMRMGKGFGDQFGVGFGNEGGGPAKQQEAEHENLKKGLGGNEQNASNPLGL